MNDRLGSLIPQPVSVRPRPGSVDLTAMPDIHLVGTGNRKETENAAAGVRHLLGTIPWPPSGDKAATVRCSVSIDAELGPEAYHLAVKSDGIIIRAGDTAGSAYAAQTIRQLLPDAAWRAAPLPGTPGWELPSVEIDDKPALTWRGAHIDVARHFATKRELLAVIDALAALKLNRLHLHLTDDQGWRIESRLHPRLHEIGSHRARTRISLNDESPPVYEEIPYGGYYTLARGFVHAIGKPGIMRFATRHGVKRPAVMRITMKLLGNLTETRGGDAVDRVINALSKIAPAA